MEITQSEKQTVGNNQSGNRQWEITQIEEIVGITPRVETDSGDYLKCGNRQWGLPRAWKQTVEITQSVETDRLWEDTEGTENAIGPRDWSGAKTTKFQCLDM